MAVKKRKPTSPGRRFQTVSDFADITKSEPEKSLLESKSRTGGRNVSGKTTSRHRGGGHKQKYRLVDFKRNKDGVPAKVAGIEYDPNRNARIALLHYVDGEKRYILAPIGVKPGDMLESGSKADIRPGNALPMRNIPAGTTVHAIEMRPGGGAKIGRSAGTAIQLVAKENDLALLRLPSGEMRNVPLDCRATVGQVGTSGGRAPQASARPVVQPLEGRAPSDPRCGHEPCRPPARWWRRQVGRWPSSGEPVGQARGADPFEEEAVQPRHRPSSQHEGSEVTHGS
jgi:large subunit ribosomal protein L2